ncbi:uncharacterized protein LOC123209439 isoform X2 [Mangifera indica]|uniref:uncharacterized protein LOC123209439 isoform X2 n=1 Tax=Mangifera indica TaxID=29780 RepID=UPI001CFB0DBE|nr:uncharacterized protein LOC123209439 isoform X2 [Mangifera indica]
MNIRDGLVGGNIFCYKKFAVSADNDELAVMVFLNLELMVWRSCDKKWVNLGFGDVDVQDIVYYKKQFHVVMSNGHILSVNPKSLELDAEEQEWIEVKDLEGRALFLFDGGCMLQVSTSVTVVISGSYHFLNLLRFLGLHQLASSLNVRFFLLKLYIV